MKHKKQTCKICGMEMQAKHPDGICDCCVERGWHSQMGVPKQDKIKVRPPKSAG